MMPKWCPDVVVSKLIYTSKESVDTEFLGYFSDFYTIQLLNS